MMLAINGRVGASSHNDCYMSALDKHIRIAESPPEHERTEASLEQSNKDIIVGESWHAS